MAIYEVAAEQIRKIEETSFIQVGLQERSDLQRLLRKQIDIITPGILIVDEEFGDWEDSKRRIDLLGVDKEANLVVIELKRTEDGGHMELQAIRYAAMVSKMTFEKVVEIFGGFLQRINSSDDAQTRLLEFLDWEEPDEDRFAQDVRIVLVSAQFSKELTGAVMWLNERGLDIRCVKIQPYADNGRVLIDVQQLIPLPEAEQYQVRIKKKEQKGRQERAERYDLRKKFWGELLARAAGRTTLHANISPGEQSRIATGSGISGLYFIYSLQKSEATAELYIDVGQAVPADKRTSENKMIFDFLHSRKGEVEQSFGGELSWQRLDDKFGCRIAYTTQRGGWGTEESKWPEVHDDMIGAMIRLEKALRPQLEKVRTEILTTNAPL